MFRQWIADRFRQQISFYVEGTEETKSYEWPDELDIWIEPIEDFRVFDDQYQQSPWPGPGFIIELQRPTQITKPGAPYPTPPMERHIKTSPKGFQIPTLLLVVENRILYLLAGEHFELPEIDNEQFKNLCAAIEARNNQIGFEATDILKQKLQTKRRQAQKEKADKDRTANLNAALNQTPFANTSLAKKEECTVADFVKELDYGKNEDTITKAANHLELPHEKKKKWRFSTKANPGGTSDAQRLYEYLINKGRTPRARVEAKENF
jgi:hypothetical protein